jgi:hypothetical protein
MAENTGLTWKHFPAGEHGFFRAPVLLSGARETVLIDGGFTLPDGCTVVVPGHMAPGAAVDALAISVLAAPRRK